MRISRRGRLVAGLTAAVGTGIGLVTAVCVIAFLLASSLSFEACEWEEPGDPGTGDRSEQLPVDVAPVTGLADGDVVAVSSTAFPAHAVVGVTVCLAEALTERRGVAACDVDGGQRFAVDADGALAVVVAVPRVVTVEGEPHDCATRAGRCLVVAADSSDFDLSGGEPVTFAAGLPPAELVAAGERARTVLLPGSVTPEGPVAAGTTVTVAASGFVPGEPVLVAQCTSGFLVVDAWEACQVPDDDLPDAFAAVALRSVAGVDTHADAQGRVRVAIDVRSTVRPLSGVGGDCVEGPDACALVVAAAADTQRSAYVPLTVSR